MMKRLCREIRVMKLVGADSERAKASEMAIQFFVFSWSTEIQFI